MDSEPMEANMTQIFSNGSAETQSLIPRRERKRSEIVDKGFRAWLVCFATAFVFGINGGMATNYPLIYNKLVEVYNSTPNYEIYTAWSGSTEFGIESLFYLPSSMLIYLIDIRIVSVSGALLSTIGLASSAFISNIKFYLITYGVIFGIGQALLKQATYAILPHYFEEKLGLANGLMNLGGSLLSLSLMLLSAHVLKIATLFYGFMLLAAFSFTTIGFAFTYKPNVNNSNQHVQERLKVHMSQRIARSLGIEILGNKEFLIWSVSSCFGLYGAVIPILAMDHYSKNRFPNYPPEIINSIFTITAGVSGVMFGKLIDQKLFNCFYVQTIGYLIWGTAQFILFHVPSYPLLVIVYILYAIGDGAFFTSIVPVAVQVAGSPDLTSQANAYFHVFVALPQVLGPIVAAFLFNRYNNYQYAFYMGAGFCFSCALCQIVLFPKRKLTRVYI